MRKTLFVVVAAIFMALFLALPGQAADAVRLQLNPLDPYAAILGWTGDLPGTARDGMSVQWDGALNEMFLEKGPGSLEGNYVTGLFELDPVNKQPTAQVGRVWEEDGKFWYDPIASTGDMKEGSASCSFNPETGELETGFGGKGLARNDFIAWADPDPAGWAFGVHSVQNLDGDWRFVGVEASRDGKGRWSFEADARFAGGTWEMSVINRTDDRKSQHSGTYAWDQDRNLFDLGGTLAVTNGNHAVIVRVEDGNPFMMVGVRK